MLPLKDLLNGIIIKHLEAHVFGLRLVVVCGLEAGPHVGQLLADLVHLARGRSGVAPFALSLLTCLDVDDLATAAGRRLRVVLWCLGDAPAAADGFLQHADGLGGLRRQQLVLLLLLRHLLFLV